MGDVDTHIHTYMHTVKGEIIPTGEIRMRDCYYFQQFENEFENLYKMYG